MHFLLLWTAIALAGPAPVETGEVWNAKGRKLLADGQAVEAERAFAKAIELLPGAVHPRANHAIALHKLHRFPEALAEADAALALSPGDAHAHLARANALDALDAEQGSDRGAGPRRGAEARLRGGVLQPRPDP